MKKFNLIPKYRGYINKADVTNVDPSYLVSGSQNVLINDGEKIQVRPGYSIYGAASTDLYPVLSSYDWITSTNVERNLRKYNTTLEVYYSSAWRTVGTFTAAALLNFAEFWSSTESKDLLLIADGTSTMKMWSGGIAVIASVGTNTLTKSGSTTWAEERFLVAGTRQVNIGGVTYTYTGGESTTTLTGVTPDPALASPAIAAGDIAIQTIRSSSNTPASSFNNDIISTINNHVFVADFDRRDIYISKNTDYTSYTYSSPRVPGEGALLTLDSNPIGFVVQEDSMYISGSKNDWYQIKFNRSADLTKEEVVVQKLKTGPGQGAYSQSSIGNAKNSVLYFSNEKTIDSLGRIENINTPQSLPLSDPIKTELESYDVTIAPHIKYFKNKTYIAFPSESKVVIYDHEKGFWQPPQILPVRRFAIIGGELYGHSNAVPETYKLFDEDVYSDNTNPIDARAVFAYRNYGRPDWKKNFDEWFTEGYISSNTTIDLTIYYDFGGNTSIIEEEIIGTDTDILFGPPGDSSIGKAGLGQQPIGSSVDSPSDLSKFRIIHELRKQDFYEVQVKYASNDVDYRWELLRLGGNVRLSTADNGFIKQ